MPCPSGSFRSALTLGGLTPGALKKKTSGGDSLAQHFAKIDVPRYLSTKRANKADRKRNRMLRAAEARSASAEALHEHFGAKSKIVAMMARGAPKTDAALKGRVRFTLPAAFSIMDSPERALAALSSLAKEMQAHRLAHVHLDFSKLTQYDLGANGVLDVLVEELRNEARQTGRRIRWTGKYPPDPGHRRFVKAMGVIKRLKILHEYPPHEEEANLELFDARSRHYLRKLRPRQVDRKGKITSSFAEHVNACLGHVGRRLTPAGLESLCRYVAEILDNAEEHGAMLDWSIQGYLDPHLPIPMCEIVIFNFGLTIAQTFEKLPSTSFAREEVQPYLDLHQRGGFFSPGWRREDLFTLIALQDRISTKNQDGSGLRGYGTVDLIEFFQRVHSECALAGSSEPARMVLVSGSTFVLFDGTYKMSANVDGNGVIAFNQGNDLKQKPDSKYVRRLDGVSFPGTLISIKFPLLSTSESIEADGGSKS